MKILIPLKTVNLWSNLNIYAGIKEKNSPKIFFHVGENLCFGIFEFLEINFRRWFFTWLHFWQCLGHFGAYSPLCTAAPILCGHVDITKIVVPHRAGLLLTFFRFWARAKKKFLPKGGSNPQPPGYESIALTTLPW